jgi:excisionase family DNA binding protein
MYRTAGRTLEDGGMDERLTVAEAADRLGITKEAVRKRIHRGTLRSDKDPDGTVRVYALPSEKASETALEDRTELVVVLRDEIAHLRRESERKGDIIMSLSRSNAELSRTIRQLEVSQEPPEGSESVGERQVRAESRPGNLGYQVGPDRPRDTAEYPVGGSLTRPWWRRAFWG